MSELIDREIILEKSKLGKKVLFFMPFAPTDYMYKFSSKLENIGIEWDCELKNNTKVIILSEPAQVIHPIGKISVVRIMAHEAMWVRAENLIEIDEK